MIGGTATLSSATVGTASYSEQVEWSGSVRGRIGYAPNLGAGGHWLIYATGGLAFSFDQFTRTQIAGVPLGGTAVPGQVESLFMVPRVGGAVGAGIEYAMPSHWTARVEYLFTDYGSRSVTFLAGAQSFNSDLALNELRFGLNYRLNAETTQPAESALVGPSAAPKPTILPSTARQLSSSNTSFRSAIPMPVRTVSIRTRAARPGMSPLMSACGCGRAPSSGSIRRSIRVLV